MNPPRKLNAHWYGTNIPIPTEYEELLLLCRYWYNRWRASYTKAHRYHFDSAEYIHYCMVYSRYIELSEALHKIHTKHNIQYFTTH